MKFPTMHIAASTVNRILNVADGLSEPSPPAALERLPHVPDTTLASVSLDSALASPPAQELPGIDQAPDPGATAAGDPLLKTMLKPGS